MTIAYLNIWSSLTVMITGENSWT